MQKCIIGMAADVAIKITSLPGKKKTEEPDVPPLS